MLENYKLHIDMLQNYEFAIQSRLSFSHFLYFLDFYLYVYLFIYSFLLVNSYILVPQNISAINRKSPSNLWLGKRTHERNIAGVSLLAS